MKQYLIFDIETVTNKRWLEKVETMEIETKISSDLPSSITNLKGSTEKGAALKQQRIEEFYAGLEERQAADIGSQRRELIDRGPLHWKSGKVVCFGYSHCGNFNEFVGDDEPKLLKQIDDRISSLEIEEYVGKSNEYFDRPFLVGRYMANDLRVPDWLKFRHTDIDTYFGFGSRGQQGKLDDYLFGIGEPGKLGKGTDVADWYAQGNWDTIAEYCRGDVAGTEKLYLRYNKEG